MAYRAVPFASENLPDRGDQTAAFIEQIQSRYPQLREGQEDGYYSDGQRKMAYMAIAAKPVNGVARPYTEILKNEELKISIR